MRWIIVLIALAMVALAGSRLPAGAQSPSPTPRPAPSPLPTPRPPAPPFTAPSEPPSGPDLSSRPLSGTVTLPPFGRVTFIPGLGGPAPDVTRPPEASPRGGQALTLWSYSEQAVEVTAAGIDVTIAAPEGHEIRVDPSGGGSCVLDDGRRNVVRCFAAAFPRVRFTTGSPPAPVACPPTCIVAPAAGMRPAVMLAPSYGFVYTSHLPVVTQRMEPTATPVVRGRATNYSDQPATVSYSPDFIISVAPGHTLRVLGRVAAACERVNGQAHVVRCREGYQSPDGIVFTTEGSRYGEAALVLDDPRPCIPEAGRQLCDAVRAALWNGDRQAWAARGVRDPDAVFNETVVYRVRAGDPAAISNIAQLLGAPYLQITRLRFAGVEPGQADEFIEVTNLGGGEQELAGWTVRAPERGIVFRFPDGLVIGRGDHCRIYTGVFPSHAERPCYQGIGATDLWPDDGGEATLFYDALALPGDTKRYVLDPANQPPPPNLRSVIAIAAER